MTSFSMTGHAGLQTEVWNPGCKEEGSARPEFLCRSLPLAPQLHSCQRWHQLPSPVRPGIRVSSSRYLSARAWGSGVRQVCVGQRYKWGQLYIWELHHPDQSWEHPVEQWDGGSAQYKFSLEVCSLYSDLEQHSNLAGFFCLWFLLGGETSSLPRI